MLKDRIGEDETKKLQYALLKILEAIDEICKSHGLEYYLIAGTMLGAVRHKGFIPWDDDADVALPRRDYDVLIKNANKWLPSEYELVSGDKDPNYPYQFARIQDRTTTYILRRQFNYIGGLPVDVFPLDGMTDNIFRQRIHYLKYNVVKKMMYFNLTDPYKHGKGFRSFFVRICHKCLSTSWLHDEMDSIQREYDYDESSLVADHDNKRYRGILPKEVYGKHSNVKFEGIVLNGVNEPDAYLSYCYGDYMKMPKDIPPQNFRYLNMKLPFAKYKKEHKKVF